MSRRRLSEEERTLWGGVVRSVVPLRRSLTAQPAPEAPESPAPAKPPTRSPAKSQPIAAKPAVPPGPPRPPPLAPLGRRFRQGLARGTRPIEGRLDLHGLTQAEAHGALLRFLRTGQARGARTVLIITGKGNAGGEGQSDRGVLKRQVPLWLRLPEFRSLVVGFEPAGVAHGGAGALYVQMRRRPGDVTT